MTIERKTLIPSVPILTLLGSGVADQSARTQTKNGPGVSDTEIIIDQTMPSSGPVSVYGVQGQCPMAFFRMIKKREQRRHGVLQYRNLKICGSDDPQAG